MARSYMDLVQNPHVLLSEDIAEGLVEATGRPPEAVLAAGVSLASRRFSHEDEGQKHAQNHGQFHSLHSYRRPDNRLCAVEKILDDSGRKELIKD